ncbi:MAG: penicillin-binding protein 2 [bacterium]|nr:penicillin-binding protein 2 [bacterium]
MGLTKDLAERSFSQRLKFVKILFFLAVAAILGRSLYLQVYLKDDLERRAARQYRQAKDIQLQRGTISDASGSLLAVSIPMQSLFVVPPEVTEPVELARNLSPLLGTGAEALYRKVSEPGPFAWLKRQVHPLLAEMVTELDLAGVHSMPEYQRFYPLQNHAAQLLGFVGIDSKGLEGLEYRYNQHLMDGSDRQETWASVVTGSPVDRLTGGDIGLTLDSRLQYYVEDELNKGLKALEGIGGVAILMETKTGRILAMANQPDFDPNKFEKFDRSTYFNRAIGVAYEPGSTFKVVTLSTALQNKVVGAEDFFYCEEGSYQIQDRVIHDVGEYGWLSLEKIIQKSSNICAAKIGLLLPKDTFYQSIRSFGFGQTTRLGLPAESAGKVYEPQDWTPVKVATMSYGHAISVTPVQMAAAINAIANDGVYVEPRIVDWMKTSGGQPLELPEQDRHRLLDPEVAKLMTRYMVSVTEPEGTGRLAAIRGLNIAAKSGTSRKFDREKGEYSAQKHISSFIGFFPAERPWVTLYVMIDEPKGTYLGGRSAAPVFRKITERIRDLDPSGQAPFESEATALSRAQAQRLDKTAVLGKDKDLRRIKHLLLGKSLREALFLAGREGIVARAEGFGLVRDLRADRNHPGGYLLILGP